MSKIPFAIVGCGGMGNRHLMGLKELTESGMCNLELVAACDLRRENAEYLADNALEAVGKRPQVFDDMSDMVAAIPDLQAVDITTDSGSHHAVASAALDLGLHMLLEKPLALTIRGCNMIIAQWEGTDRILSVAEQDRRDPMCRLLKAVLDSGALGDLTMLFQMSTGGSDRIIIWPWRHYKNVGGIVVDAGVHTSDLMQYYMGPAREVMARTGLYEPTRYRGERLGVLGFYDRWAPEVPEQITATAEDMLASLITFENGVVGQWTAFRAAHGRGFSESIIYGRKGSLDNPGSRNGQPITIHLDDGATLSGEEILDLVPEFCLDEITAKLFGGDRLASYDIPRILTDRKLLAIEYYELGRCIESGVEPEVTAYAGRKDLALCSAALESGVLNRTVTPDEIEAEHTAVYEADINAHWGI